MKRLLTVAFLTVLSLAAQAADTAYSAIRVIGKKNGEESLGRVMEVRGRYGSPEPAIWKIVVSEGGGRGVHEYEVQKGRINAERSPNGRTGGQPLDLNKLNIDSDGAFTIVNQEAQKIGKAFDRVDYALTNGGRNGAPMWHLELYDGSNGRVGAIDIAADTGDVVRRDLGGAGGSRSVAQDDREFLREQTDRERRGRVDDDRLASEEDRRRPDDRDRRYDDRRPYDERRQYRDEEELGPGITDIFGKITRHFDKRGKQIKSFFSH